MRDRARIWIDRRSGRGRLGLAVLSGILMALGHSPFDLPYLLFLAFPFLILIARSGDGVRPAAAVGWAAGTGYFGVTLAWIVEPFLVDVARHGWLAPFALVGLSGGLALFWAAAFGLAARIAPTRRPPVLAVPLCLTGFEFLRAHVLTGFPWALPAYAWADTPVAQAAAWFGPHGLGLLLLLLAALPAFIRALPAGVALGAMAGLWVLAEMRVSEPETLDGPVIRLVQPNAAQHLKWQPGMAQVFYDRLIASTQAGPPADLVVWPETAVPFVLGDRPDLMADIAAAAGPGAQVALGIRRIDATGNWYNALAILDPDGAVADIYDKSHLVPFGEYLPLRDFLVAVGLGAYADGLVGSFTPGPGPTLLTVDVPGVGRFQPLICYEAIFPHEILTGRDRPDWLMQVTNDAWFGTWSGPYQHLVQARFRAIEQGLPMVRAANTGVSAIIDPHGRIVTQLELGLAGHVDAVLPGALAPTLYARIGDRLFLVVWMALALALGIAARRGGRPGLKAGGPADRHAT